ncbi:MAG: exonuclease SbcCD subunit D [Myxococcales bacterium]
MPKFIHAADLHVDSPLVGLEAYEGAPVERIRAATRRALENLVLLATTERVQFVVLVGDVFDTDPLYETALFFRLQMQRLADAGIRVVIIRGNHDYAGIAPRSVRLPDGVTVLAHERAETVELPGGVFVHGRSYPRHDFTEDMVAGYPAPVPNALNVGLLHTSLMGFPEHDPYAPTSPDILRAHGYQYWALGHVHKRQVWDAGGVPIVFPGNLQGRHIRETGPKGATLVEYDGAKVVSYEHRSLDVMRWHVVEVDACGLKGDAVLERLRQRVFEQTAPDRERNLLCAVRVLLRVTSAPHDDLRQFLAGEVQAAGNQLWLEKLRVRVEAAAGEGLEAEAQLRALAAELATDGEASGALLGQLEKLKQQLRAAEPRLLKRAAFLPGDEPDAQRQAVAELLEKAAQLVGAELRGR